MRKMALLALLFLFAAPVPAGAAEHTLKVAVGAMLSPKETFVEYRRLVEYIGHKLGRRAEMIQRKDYSQVDQLLRDSAVDLAFICTGPYVQDRKEFGVELVAAPVVRGRSTYRSLIIVGKEAPYRSLRDLRGKSFAYTDPDSTSGCWAPMRMVALLGEDPDRFFSKAVFSNGHDNSVDAVAKGAVDGAGVDSIIFEYMKAKGNPAALKVRVIDESGTFAIPPVVAPKGTDPKLRAEARKALLEMHQDPEGKKILDALCMDKFIVPADRDYDSVRELSTYINRRGNQGKIR